MGKFLKVLLIANLCLWIYFGIAFAQASYPFRPDPLGHPAGTGYTFWGHSIAVVESGLVYPFFRVVFYVEFPSFLLATLVARVFSPHLLLNGFFPGISGGGWLLLAIMLLSFLQWYFVGGRLRNSGAGGLATQLPLRATLPPPKQARGAGGWPSAGERPKSHAFGMGMAYDTSPQVGRCRAPDGDTYDAENRMKTAAGVTYTYDGDGKRVSKSTGKLYWYGMTSDPLAESDAAGNVTDEYTFFGGKRIARRHVNSPTSDTISYYFADHLGTSRVVTNASGVVLDDSDFYPFGSERPVVSSSGNNYKFTGKERDAESGLDNFKARYFGSSMGRFSSPDPLMIMRQKLTDPQQWNMYSYVRNNPLRFLDPTGMYLCGGTEKECAAFEKARQNALKSKDKDTVGAAKAYGDPGKDNGVNVGFAKELKGDRGGQVTRRAGGIEQDATSPNGLRAALNVTIKSDLAGDEETIVHEGSHVADRQDFINAITPDGKIDQSLNITLRESEVRAYLLSIGYAQRGNKTLNFGPCGVMGECKFPPGMMPALRNQRINDLLNDPRNDYRNLDRPLYPELRP